MAPTVLEELWKRIQHCCATLRRSRNKRDVGSCWLKRLTGFKLWAATRNNMQQGEQTDATCNIQQWSCWSTMLRPFARGFTAVQGLLEKKGDVLMLFFEKSTMI